METGNIFLFQVNIPDDWNGVTDTWYTILDYANCAMTPWTKHLESIAFLKLIPLDTIPSKADLALKYGTEFGFFLPLAKPFNIHSQYPELFI